MTSDRARAYVIAGPPGGGKSVLGAALARSVRAALLDQDVLTGPLTRVVADLVGASSGDLDDPRVRSATRAATYDTLIDTAVQCLTSGVSAVLVAPFATERSSDTAWADLISRLRAPGGTVLLWADCPADELVRRLAARGAERDRRKLADVAAFLTSGALDPPAVPYIAVDTTAPIEDQLAAVIR